MKAGRLNIRLPKKKRPAAFIPMRRTRKNGWTTYLHRPSKNNRNTAAMPTGRLNMTNRLKTVIWYMVTRPVFPNPRRFQTASTRCPASTC